MITFVTGKPGDGKSMYGMSLIVQTLLHSERDVKTNIAVKLPELRAYLILKGWKPKPGRDIHDRVEILDNDQVFEFYRYRSGGYTLPPSPDWVADREGEDEDGKKIKKLSRFQFLRVMTEQMREMKKHRRALRPVEYHIDEAHDYFSAREWTTTGRGILWYASKHRHLHDEIIFYTQVMKNVEGQLRGLASFTVRARNQIRMRWGPFRKAPIFRLYHYYGGPEDTDACQAFNTGVMQLDREGLCRTYNSAGALSVHDKPEEVKNKAPLPYWALPVACGLAILLVVAFMVAMPLLAGKAAGKALEKTATEAGKAVGMPLAPGAPLPPAKAAAEQPVTTVQEKRIQEDQPHYVREPEASRVLGTMVIGDQILVRIEGQEWSRVVMPLPRNMLELANGYAVRKADVINPPKPTRPKRETAALSQ